MVAGGAVYVAYDYGLLGSGTQGEEALKKTTAAVPPAVHEWADYFGVQVQYSSSELLWSCIMPLMYRGAGSCNLDFKANLSFT